MSAILKKDLIFIVGANVLKAVKQLRKVFVKSKSTRIVSFALTEKQFLELKARAQSEGCSLSDIIRRQLAVAASNKKPSDQQ
jgi:hypothetical protein